MQAIVYSNSRTLQYAEVDKPIPRADDVLIKVCVASVNPLDYHLLNHPTMRRAVSLISKEKNPRPGVDASGIVEATGCGVKQFKPGDEVFGTVRGAFSEYACADADKLVIKPANISFQHAASVPIAAITALQGLRDAGLIRPGQSVLINGAAGGVGTFAVQIAKSMGADVTAVCSTQNVEMLYSIGADRVIDYTSEDFTKAERRYDLIFDLVANHPFSARRGVIKQNGTYVGAGMVGTKVSILPILYGQFTEFIRSQFAGQRFVSILAKMKQVDLATIAALLGSGQVTPVIDRVYSLSQVGEALEYLEQAHARGKVLISIAA